MTAPFELTVHYKNCDYSVELDEEIEVAADKEAWATGFLLVGTCDRDMAFSFASFEDAVKARLTILKIGFPISHVYIREGRSSSGD